MTRTSGQRLIFVTLPPTVKSGSDCVSSKGVVVCRNLGIDAEIYEAWPERYAKLLLRKNHKAGHLLFKYLVAPYSLSKLLPKIRSKDIVWMYDISRYATLTSSRFEECIKQRGAHYIFHLHDDWFSVPGWREAALERARLADVVGGLTLGLVQSIKKNCPFTSPALLRGPIDVDRLYPANKTKFTEQPKVVWTGNPANLKEIPNVRTLLAEVYSQRPFNFTVISGSERPLLDLPIPWSWFPYDALKEAERISGACAGLAPLEDTPYARCKDVYKVKTYMACGVPPIATAIGNNLDVIQDGKTGYLVSTTEEWEARLLELVSNPEKPKMMGAAAREDCVKRFSHAAIIPEWIEVVEAKFGRIRNPD